MIKGNIITLISKILVSTAVYCVLSLKLKKNQKATIHTISIRGIALMKIYMFLIMIIKDEILCQISD
jgi:hypothetical protein